MDDTKDLLTKNLCNNCKEKCLTHIRLCLSCHSDLTSKKYDEIYYVLVELNNTLRDYIIENIELNKELDAIKGNKNSDNIKKDLEKLKEIDILKKELEN